MLPLIDDITAAFLGALQAGGQGLAVFMLPILGVCAVIAYYREYSTTVMSSGAGMGDALAHALLLVFATGCYLFLLTHLFTMAQAALDTVFAGAPGRGRRGHLGPAPHPELHPGRGPQSGATDCRL